MAPETPASSVPNPWEVAAIEAAEGNQSSAEYEQQDSLIYPSLYSSSGFDMMEILYHVYERPDQKIDVGPVDDSCVIVLCDLAEGGDAPIVHISGPFEEMTGYRPDEVMGKNCRFLQAPPGRSVKQGSTRRHVPKDLVKRMRKALDLNTELQIEVPNFRKDGTQFTNFLTMIPISWDKSGHHHYSVGFLCDKGTI